MLKYKEIYPLYVVGNPWLPSSTWNEKFSIFYEYAQYFFSTKMANFELLGFSLPNLWFFLFCRDFAQLLSIKIWYSTTHIDHRPITDRRE
jgi:hypothetical protein